MTLENFVKNTDLNENIIWVQKYGASREIETLDDLKRWPRDFLEWPVHVYRKHENQRNGKNILILRFAGDTSNDDTEA